MESQYKRFKSKYGPTAGKRRRSGPVAAASQQFKRKRAAVVALANTRTGGYLGLEKKFFDTQFEEDVSRVDPYQVLTIKDMAKVYAEAGETGKALNAPMRGNGPTSRDGRQYRMDSIYISGTVQVSPVKFGQGIPHDDGMFTVSLVLDTQCNGVAPSPTDIYLSGALPLGAGGTQFSKENLMLTAKPFRNLANVKRFRVLASSTQRLRFEPANDGTNTNMGLYHISQFSLSANLKGMQVTCLGDNGTVADISDNGLFLVFCRDTDVGSGTGAEQGVYTVSGISRFRFHG